MGAFVVPKLKYALTGEYHNLVYVIFPDKRKIGRKINHSHSTQDLDYGRSIPRSLGGLIPRSPGGLKEYTCSFLSSYELVLYVFLRKATIIVVI